MPVIDSDDSGEEHNGPETRVYLPLKERVKKKMAKLEMQLRKELGKKPIDEGVGNRALQRLLRQYPHPSGSPRRQWEWFETESRAMTTAGKWKRIQLVS